MPAHSHRSTCSIIPVPRKHLGCDGANASKAQVLQLADGKIIHCPMLCSASPVCTELLICTVIVCLKPGHSAGVEPSFPQTSARGGVEPRLCPHRGEATFPSSAGAHVSAPIASCACIQAGTKPLR